MGGVPGPGSPQGWLLVERRGCKMHAQNDGPPERAIPMRPRARSVIRAAWRTPPRGWPLVARRGRRAAAHRASAGRRRKRSGPSRPRGRRASATRAPGGIPGPKRRDWFGRAARPRHRAAITEAGAALRTEHSRFVSPLQTFQRYSIAPKRLPNDKGPSALRTRVNFFQQPTCLYCVPTGVPMMLNGQ